MTGFSKIVVGLLTLTIIAVVVSSGQSSALVSSAGQFLAGSAKKVVTS
jgi:hypothetical protein